MRGEINEFSFETAEGKNQTVTFSLFEVLSDDVKREQWSNYTNYEWKLLINHM